MDRRRTAHYNMSQVTLNFLLENSKITASFPPLYAALIKDVQDIMKEIDTLETKHAESTKGITEEKNAAGELLTRNGMTLSRAMVVYALAVNNRQLLSIIEFSESRLWHSDDGLIKNCQVIYNKAMEHAKDLVAYSVTQAMIDGLATDIDNFSKSREKIRQATSAKDEMMKRMDVLYPDLTHKWKEIDRVVSMVKDTQQKFYVQYEKFRVPVLPPTHTLAIMGVCINALTTELIKNVKVVVAPSLSPLPTAVRASAPGTEHYSGDKGEFRFKHTEVQTGTNILTASKEGFVVVTQKIFIADGERLDVEVKMNPISSTTEKKDEKSKI